MHRPTTATLLRHGLAGQPPQRSAPRSTAITRHQTKNTYPGCPRKTKPSRSVCTQLGKAGYFEVHLQRGRDPCLVRKESRRTASIIPEQTPSKVLPGLLSLAYPLRPVDEPNAFASCATPDDRLNGRRCPRLRRAEAMCSYVLPEATGKRTR